MDRRAFIKASAAGLVASQLVGGTAFAARSPASTLPKRLKQGDTVRMVAPASASFKHDDVYIAKEAFEAMGLKVELGQHVFDRHGYLAGKDEDRAADINRAFADESVDGVICIRGGWGCNRLLPYLDFDSIKQNPKVLMGYSDITSLMNAVYAKTGMVSFHGPNGFAYWGAFQEEQARKVLFDGEATTIRNYKKNDDTLVMLSNRINTITGGVAEGVTVGGNLTVLASLVGTPYLPDMTDKILILEDVGESIYRIDRFLSTLHLAGHLDKLAGVVFGHCTDCDPQKGYGGFTLAEVFEHYFKPLNVPTYTGAQFGHIRDNHIIPVGAPVRVDADEGTVTLLKPAVV
ncbi:Muramoyltetrapeptide carboxypeptidase [Saliniradius amylolyticus]|uniref:Muramoyltetrapeptide carboxypeptidase n=1 Tax=Saliniradius amylolyticus TaxID=2183582 RepID=A0A2S2E0B3_9ALTE|nr:LD-carboxypeptidase [Saliniradius amylolyticus]AWL11066.1 Muramoyltetrapeptide carboxypeptidase [Saliniradius amylolyticus]